MARTLAGHLRIWGALLFAFALLPASSSIATAGTSISYSQAENAYGWCAGPSYRGAKAARCSGENCRKSGGSACSEVLACPGNDWGAVSLAETAPYGIGVACGISGASMARLAALASCLVATHDVCWTATTFHGGAYRPRNENNTFDLIAYAQLLLALADSYSGPIDGNWGPDIRDAVLKFQTGAGLEADARVDARLIHRMVDAVGGAQALAEAANGGILDGVRASFGNVAFGSAGGAGKAAPLPAPMQHDDGQAVHHDANSDLAPPDDFDQLARPDQLGWLSRLVVAAGGACPAAATDAEEITGLPGFGWYVQCGEGNWYTYVYFGSAALLPGRVETHTEGDDSGEGD